MGKSQYNNFIKHYDTIREILRDFYIYGCYTRDNFSSKSTSGRKYDNERRRILSYIDEMHVVEKNRGHQKYISLSYDMYTCTRNFLSDTFLSKSFSRNDIMLHFYILQLLAEKDAPMSLDEIIEALDILPSSEEGFDRNTVRRKLEKMIKEELLETEKDKTKKMYKIAGDLFQDFDDEELTELLYAIEFFSNTAPITLPGHYAGDTLKNYITYERNFSFTTEDIFMYKHNHLQRIIDDEILWELMEIMESSSLASFSYLGKDNIKTVKPLKIIMEFLYGRQYLLGIDCQEDRLCFYRIDRIKNLKRFDNEILHNTSTKCYDKCWCASFGRSGEENVTTKVEAEFLFDEVSEGYVKDRIIREGRWGELHKISQNKYLYTIEVTDPEELLPWLRSFGEHVRVMASDKHKLDAKLKKTWKELLIKYGAV